MPRLPMILAAAMLISLGSAARADDAGPGSGGGLVSELKLGALYHDVPGLWSGFSLEKPTVDGNVEIDFRPIYQGASMSLLPALGATINPDGDTSHVYADIRWKLSPNPMWYVTFGFGAAFHNGFIETTDPYRKALGSRLLFHPSLEVGINLDQHDSLSIYFEHMSNADTQTYNEGMDDLGVRYGYHF